MPSMGSTKLIIESTQTINALQDLPTLVLEALVNEAQAYPSVFDWDERRAATYVITRYDVNQAYAIGELMMILSGFFQFYKNLNMVRFYYNHGCNMVLTKLSWREEDQ